MVRLHLAIDHLAIAFGLEFLLEIRLVHIATLQLGLSGSSIPFAIAAKP
jgi:hypothetical protein